MKREEAQKHIEVIKAFAEGKLIQYKSNVDNEWIDVIEPTFNDAFKWRIKPEPREYWIKFSRGDLYPTDVSLFKLESNSSYFVVHVKEVIE